MDAWMGAKSRSYATTPPATSPNSRSADGGATGSGAFRTTQWKALMEPT